MAEFGENLRRAREKCGMTQQTLADKIYVTRQAVSRWEGGSRYPDLMTAKKLAQLLDTTLDALVKDDDMTELPERNPVAEFPLSKRIQTALMTLCFAPYLLCSLWYTLSMLFEWSNWFTEGGYFNWLMLVSTYLLTGLSGYGVVMSVRDNITPVIAGAIAGVFFGVNVVHACLSMVISSSPYLLGHIIAALPSVVAGGIMVLFFSGKKIKTPKPVYAVALAKVLMSAAAYGHQLTQISRVCRNWELSAAVTSFAIQFFSGTALLLLLCYMAHELDVKRKVCATGANNQA